MKLPDICPQPVQWPLKENKWDVAGFWPPSLGPASWHWRPDLRRPAGQVKSSWLSPHPAPHISKWRRTHKRVHARRRDEAWGPVVNNEMQHWWRLSGGNKGGQEVMATGNECSLQKCFPFIQSDLWLDAFEQNPPVVHFGVWKALGSRISKVPF